MTVKSIGLQNEYKLLRSINIQDIYDVTKIDLNGLIPCSNQAAQLRIIYDLNFNNTTDSIDRFIILGNPSEGVSFPSELESCQTIAEMFKKRNETRKQELDSHSEYITKRHNEYLDKGHYKKALDILNIVYK